MSLTFRDFLITASKLDFLARPAWADIAVDVANDPNAPKATSQLIVYLNERGVDSDLIGEALKAWRAVKRGKP